MVVDRFSKMAHFISCHKVDDVCNIVNLFFKEDVRFHGLSRSIVSDPDSKFLRHFWKVLWDKLDTKLMFSTTSRPQTEAVNRTLSQMLRCFIFGNPRVWEEDLIPHIEFAYNRIVNSTTSTPLLRLSIGSIHLHLLTYFLLLYLMRSCVQMILKKLHLLKTYTNASSDK